jgi:hypothetical protein
VPHPIAYRLTGRVSPGTAAANDLLARVPAGLEGPDRRAVELLAQGRDTTEMAADLGFTPAVVRARLRRLRRLREAGFGDRI